MISRQPWTMLAWIATFSLSAEQAVAQPPDYQNILSLRRPSNYVIVTTADALYRARLDNKKWQRLNGKTVPESGGRFADGPTDERTLYYYVTAESRREAAFQGDRDVKKPKRPGLYRSNDHGESWELMNEKHDFQQVVHMGGGRLFALTVVPKGELGHQRVLLSDTSGCGWKDVTNGVTTDYPWLSFIRDPDHANRVCLYSSNTIRSGGTVLQADDDKFRWKSVHSSLRSSHDAWPPDAKKTDEEFFYHWYFVGYHVNWPGGTVERLPDEFPRDTFRKEGGGISTSAMIYARLDNYFSFPFGNEKGYSGFDILPEKSAYEFMEKQPFLVNVTLIYHSEREIPSLYPQLVDARDAKHLWSLKVSGPRNQKRDLWPNERESKFLKVAKGEKLADRLKKHDAWQFRLTPKTPMKRAIDLRELGMPTEPGKYRVQLRYGGCHWVDDKEISRTLNTVTGPVFEVTIQAGDK